MQAGLEIPLLATSFYLFREVQPRGPVPRRKACLVQRVLDREAAAFACCRDVRGRHASGGEFGWGGTSVKR